MSYKENPLIFARKIWELVDSKKTATWIAENLEDFSGSVQDVRKLNKMRHLNKDILKMLESRNIGFSELDRKGDGQKILRLAVAELKAMSVSQIYRALGDQFEVQMVKDGSGTVAANVYKFPNKKSEPVGSKEVHGSIRDEPKTATKKRADDIDVPLEAEGVEDKVKNHVEGNEVQGSGKPLEENKAPNKHRNSTEIAPKYKQYIGIVGEKIHAFFIELLTKADRESLLLKFLAVFVLGLTLSGSAGQPILVRLTFLVMDVLFFAVWLGHYPKLLKIVATTFVIVAASAQPASSLLNESFSAIEKVKGFKAGDDVVKSDVKNRRMSSAQKKVDFYSQKIMEFNERKHPLQKKLELAEKEAGQWVEKMKGPPYKLVNPIAWDNGKHYAPFLKKIESIKAEISGLELKKHLKEAREDLKRADSLKVSEYSSVEKEKAIKNVINSALTDGVSLIARFILIYGIIAIARKKYGYKPHKA